jgi:EAL domain-containing protein (putative c-di-GMP-specific phosphodiesterase class I)
MSVDDFGTGYSSLAYLRRLPINEVKVDKSFVFTMVSDPEDLAIVRTIVELARNLRLKVVAEGVESELARTMLHQIGCDVAQGYFFSRPVPVDGLERWIEARTVTQPLPHDSGSARRLRVVSA